MSTACTPGGCGLLARPVATARAHEDHAPRTGRTREGRSLHPCALLAVRHGVALKPPTPRHVWYEHEAHAERVRATRTARGCRPRPRRSHAGHGTTGSICYVPHTVRRGACTKPPCALGCAFEREARAERAQNHRAARGAHPRPRGQLPHRLYRGGSRREVGKHFPTTYTERGLVGKLVNVR